MKSFRAAGSSIIALTMAAAFVAIASSAVHAQDIGVTVNGDPVTFQGIGPQQIEGRTLVPVRGVLEKLGADVSYNAATQVVTASTASIDIRLTIGSRDATVNGRPVTLDVPAQVINDHTFVPLRFLGESLGADVRWDAATRTVVIQTAGQQTPDRDNAPGRDRRDDRDRNGDRRRRPEGPPPAVNSFSIRAGRWLRGGDSLEATLEGTPGGTAEFRIPGVVDSVPMNETEPGRYVGTWQAPADRRMRVRSAAVIGSLTVGSRAAPLIQAGQTISIDTAAPEARDMAPADHTAVNDPRPTISAAFEDDGSGIDARRVRLEVNGADVTGAATVTRDFITYRPDTPLPAGDVRVELTLTNEAGNESRMRWAFTEQERIAAGIRSVSDDAARVLQPGDVFHAEMRGTPGGRAEFSAGSIRDVPMREVQPGRYVGEYTVRTGDDIENKPIAYRLVTPDGQRFEQSSAHTIRIDTGKPAPPAILRPAPDRPAANPLVVTGRAQRFARVHVRVDYESRLLGVVGIHGTAADVTVRADREGNWQTDPINVGGILGNRGVEYTVTATAVNDRGEASDPSSLRFRMQ